MAWAPSPVVFSCMYGGEDYDARKEMPGGTKRGSMRRVPTGSRGRWSGWTAFVTGGAADQVMKEYKPVKVADPSRRQGL